MSESASKVNKLSEQNQENSSTSKEDSEVDQVKLRARIHVLDTSLQLTSVIEMDSCIEVTSRTDESENSALSTVPMDDSNISVQSTVNLSQPIDSIITTNSSVHLPSRINEASDISVQTTTSMNGSDISVEATTLLNAAHISVQQTTPISEAEMATRSTTPMNDANISVETATSMSKAAISTQATASMSEADISVQPTYPCNVEDLTARINKVKIAVPSTVPMTVAMHDANCFAESIHEADTIAQPTELISEADLSSTVKIKEADRNAQLTQQIREADLSSTEEYQEAFRIFQWIELKLDILKTVQGIDENADSNVQKEHRDVSLNGKSTLLERMLEEISQQMTSTNISEKDGYFSKEVTRMLNMLQETTMEVLDSFKVSKNTRPTIKVLAILFHHLVANIGYKVAFHDVQRCIDGQHVMKLFTDVQIAREPRYQKMSIVKSNLELGIRRAQYLKRKSRWYKSKAEWIHSEEFARTAGIQSANQQLKTLAKESEEILKTYAKVVKFVLTKAKVFMTLKTDNEDVLGYFLTREIHDMYKEEI